MRNRDVIKYSERLGRDDHSSLEWEGLNTNKSDGENLDC